MFAIIEDGSRQYRVQEGDSLEIDYRAQAAEGEAVTFQRVLLAGNGSESSIGRPHIEGAVVEAEVTNPEFKGKKLEIQKIRRRKNSRRHTGHRQKYTSVVIKSISVPGLEAAPEPKSEPAAASEEESGDAES